MRSEKELKDKLTKLERKLETEKILYSAMHQIDMQSSSGSSSLKFINRTKGEIKTLKWVLNIL